MQVLGRRNETGAEGAYEALFRREFAPLVRALTLVAGDVEAAADAVQDAFVQAHRHWDKVVGLESPIGWVRHVALNRIRNQHRGRQRQDEALPRLVQPDALDVIDLHQGAGDVLQMLDDLAPQQRAAIALYYLLDQPTSAVAEHLGLSEATVRSHLRAARQRLRTIQERES